MSCCGKQADKPCDKGIKESVKEYYGKRLKTTEDLQTNVCTQPCGKIPQHVKDALKMCHDEVISKYYGCGLVFPEVLEGTNVLDLGSGSGRDCFVLSKMVGEKGHVVGVDMTQEQIDVANKYHDYHAEKFGYSKPNTQFILGDIENLGEAGIKDGSVDVIVSNCVVNLTSNKKSVLQESFRVLKEGGELYFSDVYADRHLSDDIRKHEVLWGECIAGALWWRELVDLCKEVGLSGPYLVDGNKTVVEKEELKKVLGDAAFVSATYRLFKVPRLDDNEDGFEATYKGSIEGFPEKYKFDVFHTFETGKPQDISANMADILRQSRYASHFDVTSSSSAPKEPVRDAYAIADPFKGMCL
ncbi:arsenite methyltransferase-like isoform X2 [Actinia tenebrosa]|uniref:Arsenite methyltransferase n=1 Tax=Actinia tenebrosa TaxID=6105 RepID=A0A6P8ITM4_ACTTE|nr:arsenite methyltransferase-like isoform X2 [Actinia tenebrosa]